MAYLTVNVMPNIVQPFMMASFKNGSNKPEHVIWGNPEKNHFEIVEQMRASGYFVCDHGGGMIEVCARGSEGDVFFWGASPFGRVLSHEVEAVLAKAYPRYGLKNKNPREPELESAAQSDSVSA